MKTIDVKKQQMLMGGLMPNSKTAKKSEKTASKAKKNAEKTVKGK